MKRALKWIVIVIVLLVVGAGVYLYANLNHIIKTTVETQGTQQLKVSTKLDGVALSIFGGSVDLHNLSVGSPQGFAAPEMFSIGSLKVDTGGLNNLRKEPIHVSSINVYMPKLVIEQQNLKLNFKALMDNLPSNPDTAPTEPAGDKKPVKLIIDRLTVGNAHVIVRPGIPGMTSQEIDLPIPAIELQNIGNADGANNGAAIKDVVTAVITAMASKAADSDKLPAPVRELLRGNLNDVKDKVIGAAKNELNKVTSDLTKKLPGDAGKLLNNVTGGKGADVGNTVNNAAQGLFNQGLGKLGATTQPGK